MLEALKAWWREKTFPKITFCSSCRHHYSYLPNALCRACPTSDKVNFETGELIPPKGQKVAYKLCKDVNTDGHCELWQSYQCFY